jgi:hypothetical protein
MLVLNECQLGGSNTPMRLTPRFLLQDNYDEGIGSLHPPTKRFSELKAGVPKSKSYPISISSYAERMIHASKPKYPRQNCNLFHYLAVWAMVQSQSLCRHVIATLRLNQSTFVPLKMRRTNA